MDAVLDRLWIGSSADVDGGPPLRALGFRAVVDLRDRPTPIHDVNVHQLGNRDGDAWTSVEVDAVYEAIDDGIYHGKVLIVCGAGMSRSASIVVGYLVRSGWDAAAAFSRVKSVRPIIQPAPAMLQAALAAATGA